MTTRWMEAVRRGRRSVLAMLLLMSISLGAGCNATRTSDRDLVFVEAADAPTLVVAKRGVLGIGGSSGGVYVDPRSAREFRQGHIPGAIHLPFDRVRDEHETLRGRGTVIVYGTGFRNTAALAMSKTLLELGYDVRTMHGGLEAWTKAGLEVVTGEE